MATFSNQDIIHYYDLTGRNTCMFWKLDKSMRLHYGIWDKNTKALPVRFSTPNVFLRKWVNKTLVDN